MSLQSSFTIKSPMTFRSSVLFSVIIILVLGACQPPPSSRDNNAVTIYRDTWGVPHIHGKTDADVAYGLAWASAEDDVQTVQEQLLAIRGFYGEAIGKEGIVADIAIKYMGIRDYAINHVGELDGATRKLIDGYVEGMNAYAMLHSDEVICFNVN